MELRFGYSGVLLSIRNLSRLKHFSERTLSAGGAAAHRAVTALKTDLLPVQSHTSNCATVCNCGRQIWRANRSRIWRDSQMSNSVHIFWDNSNVFIGAQVAARNIEARIGSHDLRIQFNSLYELARAGRQVQRAVCTGSVPPELDAVWRHIETNGVTVELYERGAGSGTEQGIDQCLQVQMLRTALDFVPPGICVLLTGDGAGYEDGVGFHADLERMRRLGWGIEVLSWELCCNRKLMAWAKKVGVFVRLEDYYPMITFLKGLRNSQPLSLTRRKTSK